MTNILSSFYIKNFKSIQKGYINNCGRINLFIGKSNVGKSNILEALSLYNLPNLLNNTSHFNLKQLIRVEHEPELFYDGDTENTIVLKTLLQNNEQISIVKNKSSFFFAKGMDTSVNFGFSIVHNNDFNMRFGSDVFMLNPAKMPQVKFQTYIFNKNTNYETTSNKCYLDMPYGENLFAVIQNNKELKHELVKLMKNHGLHPAFNKSNKKLVMVKTVENGDILFLPFSSIAESLQRVIFYKAAIRTNNGSVIILEEPELNSSSYTDEIIEDIIAAKNNQFFITTHSCSVINKLLKHTKDELSIYMVELINGQTVIKYLKHEELVNMKFKSIV